MTEEEHKKTWCPAGRTNLASANAAQPDNRAILCIGSACAWWRWIPVSPVRWEGNTMVMQYPDPKPSEGYCGPAGKP